MEIGHKHALHDLQEASDMTQNAQIKSLLGEIIPTVKQHEKMASELKMNSDREMAGQVAD